MTQTENIEEALVQLPELLPDYATWVNSFFKGSGSSEKLISGGESLKLDRKAKKFTATTPIWIRFISFTTDDPKLLKAQLKCRAITIDGKIIEKSLTIDAKQTFCFAWFNALCTSFEIQSNGGLFKKSALSKISINGFDLDTFEKVASSTSEALELKSKIEDYVENKKEELASIKTEKELTLSDKEKLEPQIISLKENLESEESKLTEIKNTITKEKAQLEALESSIRQANSNRSDIENNVTALKASSTSLIKNIALNRQELEQITNDRSLISDEYKDFVKEGKSQVSLYFLLSILPLTAIVLCIGKLFSSAETILTNSTSSFSEVAATLITRLPFTLILILAIGVSAKIAFFLLSRAIEIHRDRLTLARLLVIAKDTVFSSTQGLTVSDESKFRERIRLKIELLKSHLSKDLDKDFSYTPTNQSSDKEKPEEHTEVEESRETVKPQMK